MRQIRREAVVLTTFYEKSAPEPFSERTPVYRNIRFGGITGDARIAGELTGLAERPLQGISFTDVQLDAVTGFTIKDVEDISFHQVVVNTEKGPAIAADNTNRLELSGVRTGRAHAAPPVVDLKNVRNVFIHGCSAAPDTETFLRAAETADGEVVLTDNNFTRAKEPIVRAPAEK
jgi:hypothetical protein